MPWKFMVSDRRFGTKRIVSPNCDEVYMISTRGSWVPDCDVEYLLGVTWRCPASGIPVKPFSIGNPTREKMKQMPEREPQQKQKQKRARVPKEERPAEETREISFDLREQESPVEVDE